MVTAPSPEAGPIAAPPPRDRRDSIRPSATRLPDQFVRWIIGWIIERHGYPRVESSFLGSAVHDSGERLRATLRSAFGEEITEG